MTAHSDVTGGGTRSPIGRSRTSSVGIRRSGHRSRLLVAILAMALACAATLPAIAGAAPFVGADVAVNGSDFSVASGQWTVDGTAVVSNVADEWVEYQVDLTAGPWVAGLEAINDVLISGGNLGADPSWYPQFEFSTSVSGETLVVPASDTSINHGGVTFDVPADGTYTVRFTWLNDQAEGPLPGGGHELDANVRIERVFFESLPDVQPGQFVRNPSSGHRYALTEGLSFADARAQAVAWGGDLVTIDDQVEQNWLYEQFGSGGWMIGLNDIDAEGTFGWASGEPVTYTNWCPGEPNDANAGEDAVSSMGPNGTQCWNDVPEGGQWVAEVVDGPPVQNPTITVGPAGVFGSGWTDGTTVTLTVNGQSIGSTQVQVGASAAGNDFQFAEPIPQPGDVVVVEDDVPAPDTTTRTHTARFVSVGQPDAALDTVSGTGPRDEPMTVQAWNGDFTVLLGTRHVDASPTGEWQADFANPGPGPDEQDIVSLAGQGVVALTSPDAEGNSSYGFVGPPSYDPAFWVFPATSSLFGQGWSDGETVAVEIDDPATPANPDYAGTGTVVGEPCPPSPCGPGNFGLVTDPYVIKPGDVVTATDGTTVKTHTVTTLTVTGVDAVTDTVTGTAEPGSEVGALVPLPDGNQNRSATTDEQGNWIVDYSVAAGGQQPYDIQPGSFPFPQSSGFASQGDADGDATFVQWGLPNFNVGGNGIWGDRWVPGSEVSVTIAGTPGYSTTAPIDENGNFNLFVDPNQVQIQVGDVITVTDGNTTKTTMVSTLAVTGVDTDADTVTGTAEPGSEIIVVTGVLVPGEWLDLRLRTVTADDQGVWTADFSVAAGRFPRTRSRTSVRAATGSPPRWTTTATRRSVAGTCPPPTPPSREPCTSATWRRGTPSPGSSSRPARRTTSVAPASPTGRADTGSAVCSQARTASGRSHPAPTCRAVSVRSSWPSSRTSWVRTSSCPSLRCHPRWGRWSRPSPAEAPCPSTGRMTSPSRPAAAATRPATFEITVLDDGYTTDGEMTETPEGSGTYTATIPPLYPHHGAAEIVYTISCPDGSTEGVTFFIYIDPSGVVVDTNGDPVAGATVTLFSADNPEGPFTEVPDGSVVMSASNRTNPDATDTAGLFGWDVVAGYYTVRVEKDGCHAPGDPQQPFVETPVLTIPPPVTDLELVLECPAPNAPPTADGQLVATDEDTPLPVVLSGSDPDSDPLTFAVVSGPTHGTLSGTAPNLTYTPAENYDGPDSFTFTVSDGEFTSDPANVSIGVNAVNDAPVGVADDYSTPAGTLLMVGAPGVLGNDTDVDDTQLAATVETQPSHGTVTVNMDGSFAYQPDDGYIGVDTFTYRAVDSSDARSEPTTVTIEVENGTACEPLSSVRSVSGRVYLEGGAKLSVKLRSLWVPFGRPRLWVGTIGYWDPATRTVIAAVVWTTNPVVEPIPDVCRGVRIRVDALQLHRIRARGPRSWTFISTTAAPTRRTTSNSTSAPRASMPTSPREISRSSSHRRAPVWIDRSRRRRREAEGSTHGECREGVLVVAK